MDIAEAYEVLGDEEMRVRYDRGEDVMDKNGGGGGRGGHGGFPGQGFRHGGGGQQFNFNFGGR